MKAKLAGVVVLLVLILGAVLYKRGSAPAGFQGTQVAVNGVVGGEKIGFLEDSVVKKTLLDRFGIEITYAKAGSLEMARGDLSGKDFLWPSGQAALEVFRTQNAGRSVKSEVVFNTPLVLYSWDLVQQALERNSIVSMQDNVAYVTDFPALAKGIVTAKKWKDMGATGLYGNMGITTTDPNLSSSGFMFVGLVANILHGDVVDEASVDSVLPALHKFYKSLGYMEKSSGDIFQQYLNTGVGAKPLIAGYESQMIEFALQNPSVWPSFRQKVRILYPQPTLWVAHPLISLSPAGDRLLSALRDPEIQKLAWTRHGFRPGVVGIQIAQKDVPVDGVPAQILQVVALPGIAAMNRLVAAISHP